MPQLRHLDLSGTQVTDAGLEALRELPNLETISLAWTAVTDAGVASLARCRHLTRVDLAGTGTGDGAIKALTGMQALRIFSSGNGVTDAGIAHLHAFPVFRSWQALGAPEASADMDGGPNSLMLRGAHHRPRARGPGGARRTVRAQHLGHQPGDHGGGTRASRPASQSRQARGRGSRRNNAVHRRDCRGFVS